MILLIRRKEAFFTRGRAVFAGGLSGVFFLTLQVSSGPWGWHVRAHVAQPYPMPPGALISARPRTKKGGSLLVLLVSYSLASDRRFCGRYAGKLMCLFSWGLYVFSRKSSQPFGTRMLPFLSMLFSTFPFFYGGVRTILHFQPVLAISVPPSLRWLFFW